MARWEFKLPDIGEGVTEGEVVAWLIKVGDMVAEDQPMVEVMTDKATVTITAPRAGKVVHLFGDVGQIIKVHSPLVAFEAENGGGVARGPLPATPVPSRDVPSGPNETLPPASAVGDLKDDLPGTSWMRSPDQAQPPAPIDRPVPTARNPPVAAPSHFEEKPLATPATRQLARDLQVDLRRVAPTGPSGRVTREDVERAHQASGGMSALAKVEKARRDGAPQDERIPFIGIRRRIAERMTVSLRTAAQFTFVEECEVTELRALRDRLRPRAEAQGVKLNFLPIIAKAVTLALARYPLLNSTLDEAKQEILLRRDVHLGIAVSTEAGLMVPVISHCERRSILDLAREIDRLATSARDGTIRPSELTGSTFTITSLGQRGGLLATPIINYPEVGIVGVHRMRQRPIVRDGQIVIGEVMMLSLSFDHRIVDGDVAAAFAYELIGMLEDPTALLLGM